MSILTCLSDYLARLVGKISCACLFPMPPTIQFGPKQDRCRRCHSSLKVRKTYTHKVITLHIGTFYARETASICDQCQCTYRSEELSKLVPAGANFGYDIIVFAGKALFLRHRNNWEVVAELAEKNIQISPREISCLGKKFITYLAIAHRQCTGRIREAMQLRGGYILHLDGTCEGKGPLLMSGLDSITDIVLGNVKLPSEKADQIIPFLKDIKERFGTPLASVHDMGTGILNAVAQVFPDNPDFICHFHFLRDIGKDLFGDEYETIRQRLRKHGITTKLKYRAKQLKRLIDKNPDVIDVVHSAIQNHRLSESCLELVPTISVFSLILWALEGKNQGQGYGFPFDRPHLIFVKRLQQIYCHIDHLKEIQLRRSWRDNRPYFKIMGDMKKIMEDKVLAKTVERIEPKIELFDKLRDAMRIAPASGRCGLNHDGMKSNIGTIQKRVKKFRLWLTSRKEYSTNNHYQKMTEQIDKYWKKLFADPITVETSTGRIQIQPQRTNNIMERRFRALKRDNRRKTGNNSSSIAMRNMLPETPLIKNLQNPEYMRILLDGKTTIEELFAEIDINKLRQELRKAQQNPNRIPAKIKRIINEPQYPERLANILSESELPSKSNHILRQ